MGYKKKENSSNFLNRLLLSQDCIFDAAFEAFTPRWTAQVLFCIYLDINRFSHIKKKLDGISDHILGVRLNKLVEKKLIQKKTVGGEKVYVITAKGRDLVEIIESLARWQAQANR
ncbi:MAG: helix-turn-helix domain-containing protein [Bacteriovorax sp.]|nr:helix-turn-helix domain-containing protein [Bacteriovorax sp.]